MPVQSVSERIEQALHNALAAGESPDAPPRLVAAVRHAVFPAGARIRPRLVLAVARACGEDDPALTDAAAVAVELLHCASLVHDDLPCFDDASLRRGRPSVHRAFGERLAVLAGDGLIVEAFHAIARAGGRHPQRLPALLAAIAQGVSLPTGIVAGQAWECEPRVVLADYQRAKTGALFSAAAAAGAVCAGSPAAPWTALGAWLGEAYQVADDIRDATVDVQVMGKAPGRDAALGRPSAAAEHGLGGAVRHFERLIAGAVQAIPPCPGAAALRALVVGESERLIPSGQRSALLDPARDPALAAARVSVAAAHGAAA